jgi:hypothetical protein
MRSPLAFISIALLSLLGFMAFHPAGTNQATVAPSMAGAYHMSVKQGNETFTAVKIVTGSYFTIAYYDLAGKKFAGTEGGTYSVNGSNYQENIEFNTMDSTRVGSTVTLQSLIKGSKWQLSGTKYGKKIAETWEQISEEKAQNSPLQGAWRITQRADPDTGTMSAMQQGPRKTLKMMSDTRFQWIAYNRLRSNFPVQAAAHTQPKTANISKPLSFSPVIPSEWVCSLLLILKCKAKTGFIRAKALAVLQLKRSGLM